MPGRNAAPVKFTPLDAVSVEAKQLTRSICRRVDNLRTLQMKLHWFDRTAVGELTMWIRAVMLGVVPPGSFLLAAWIVSFLHSS